MMKGYLEFEGKTYASTYEMTQVLLEQANEKIIRIDVGERPNTPKERLPIKLWLLQIDRCVEENITLETKAIIGSVWSQFYRLEHQEDYIHPYLSKTLEQIQNANKKNSG
ncbi:hypothetical protein ACQKL0_19750 [Peribacillus sp. NPDC097264]|uniref:hypothetical protein n=1 Tax=Peribacillus sp. NPDC097264 TaxID=3390616 RepID=UPI003D053B3B